MGWECSESGGNEVTFRVEILGVDGGETGASVESVLRWVSEVSAFLEAALSVKVERVSGARAASEGSVKRLEAALARSGVKVERHVLWAEAPEAEVWAGEVRGLSEKEWRILR